MKENPFIILIILISLLSQLLSCATDPKLLRRYASKKEITIERKADGTTNLPANIQVYLPELKISSVESKTKETPKTLFDLSSEGQAEYIKVSANNMGDQKNNDKLRGDLPKPIKIPLQKPKIDKSRLKYKRNIIVSISNESDQEADRIRKVKILMKLVSPDRSFNKPNAKFVSWDKFKSEFEKIELGETTVNQTTTIGGELGISGPVGPAIGSAGLNFQRSESISEKQKHEGRIINFSGFLDVPNDEASFQRTGSILVDLTGESNLTLDIEIEDHKKVFVTYFNNLFKDGEPNVSNEVKVTRQEVWVPKTAQAACMNVIMDYKLRHVTMGEETYIEGDDNIIEVDGEIKKNAQVIINPEELTFESWSVIDLNTGSPLFLDLQKNVKICQEADPEPIKFSSSDDASAFMNWLIETKSNTIGKRDIYVMPEALISNQCAFIVITKEKLQKHNLIIKPTFENCKTTSVSGYPTLQSTCYERLDSKDPTTGRSVYGCN